MWALKVVEIGEWSVPSGPAVLPIEDLYCLGPPIISKVAAFAYITHYIYPGSGTGGVVPRVMALCFQLLSV